MFISEEYQRVLVREHQIGNWGMVGILNKDLIISKCNELKITKILDYGCGQGLLKKGLEPNIFVTNYDPGIPEWSILPEVHELVVCFDVLEHVEEQYVSNVLDHISTLTRQLTLITVSTTKAKRILNNGQNAHITIKSIEWWEEKFLEHFNIIDTMSGNLYILKPKK